MANISNRWILSSCSFKQHNSTNNSELLKISIYKREQLELLITCGCLTCISGFQVLTASSVNILINDVINPSL